MACCDAGTSAQVRSCILDHACFGAPSQPHAQLSDKLCADPPGNCVRELRGHAQGILDMAVSPDFSMVVTASDDKTCRMFKP